MTATLYRWPAPAAFGRVIPKTKFYEHAKISPTVREKFVSEVQRIIWAYKLADETIGLSGDSVVPEIQVFTVDAKDENVSDDVLTAIDKAVTTPIIFEVNRESTSETCTRMVAAHKQLGAATPRISAYFTTDWVRADVSRSALPPAISLPGLYAQLLTPLLPLAPRPGEALSETTARVDQARSLEREVAGLGNRIRSEPQFNRKVELGRQLRYRANALAELTDPATPKGEDLSWRS